MESLIEQYKKEPNAEFEIRFKLNRAEIVDFIKKIKDKPFEVNQSVSLIKNIIDGGSESEAPYTGELPLKRLNYSDEQIHNMFNNLRNYNYYERIVKKIPYKINKIDNLDCRFEGEFITVKSLETDYEDFNQLSDMFQEVNRLKCKVYTEKMSPYDYFIMNKHEIESFAKQKYSKLTNYTVREALFEKTRECSSFRPNIMVTFIKMFNVKSVLDFSSGWGDRLIGCMSQDVEYCGVDPNENLHPKYQEMIKFFNKDPSKYTMICDSIQDATLPDKEFDMVFTSPPYFDLESYQGKKQSIESFSNENAWFDNFLSVALQKCWNRVRNDGYMCVNINQKSNKETYVTKMVEFMKSLDLADYLGVISYTNERHTNNPQPIFIIKKNIHKLIGKPSEEEKEKRTINFIESYKDIIAKTVTAELIPPILTFDKIPHRLQYKRIEKVYTNKAHFGQRKLFLSELQYLTNNSDQTHEFVVYAGAAAGLSRYELGVLFPKIKFIMVDPNEFGLFYSENESKHQPFFNYPKNSYIHTQICYIKRSHKQGIYQQTEDFEIFAGDKHYLETNLSKFITTTNYQFYLIEDYYTMDLSKKLEPLNKIGNVHFWSDIRTVSKGPSDLDILWNSAMHMNWIYYLKPKKAMLKFKLPFRNEVEFVVAKHDDPLIMKDFDHCRDVIGLDLLKDFIDNKPFRYYDGTIFLQTREPFNSTETRLVVDNFKTFIDYDLPLYEDKFFYYNNITRTLQSFINPASAKNLGFDHCSDCAIEYDIWHKYLKSKNNVIKFYDLNTEIKKRVWYLGKLTNRTLFEQGHGTNFV